MINFELDVEDVAHVHFALSPMLELITGLRVLRDAGQAGMHTPWVRETLPVAHRLPLATIFALVPPTGPIPDFLTPPPTSPTTTFAEELQQIRDTPPDRLQAEIRSFLPSTASPELSAALERPADALERVVAGLQAFWDRAFAASWPRVRALLDADIAYRASCLATGGAASLFGDLHPEVTWHAGRVEVDIYWREEVRPSGRGLVLAPSALMWQRPACIIDAPSQPTIVYPARGVALLWNTDHRVPGALERVLGHTRATLLVALDAPRTTTALAAALDMSAGGISAHLTALRDAGLLASVRQGHSVLYARTPLADQLIDVHREA